MRSLGSNVALSHQSSLLETPGCSVWNVDLSRVHVTRLDGGAGRVEGDVVHHEGSCHADDLVERDGRLATTVGRAVIESASIMSVESGLVAADSALHSGAVDEAELTHRLSLMKEWPNTRKVELVVRMADGRAESVGESRSRYLFWSQGLPRPDLQFRVYDHNGNLIGITDFAWPEYRLLGEFDGKVKYGRLLKPGQEPGDVVFGEKQREDELREVTGFAMIRPIWADLYRPVETAARARRLMRRAA
jgi:hypothetical protein